MNALWQNVIAWLLIAAAASYLIRQVRRLFVRSEKLSGCGSCSSCPPQPHLEDHSFVSLDSLRGGREHRST